MNKDIVLLSDHEITFLGMPSRCSGVYAMNGGGYLGLRVGGQYDTTARVISKEM